MRTVIIGAGAAGISAAVELAKRKPWEEVLVLASDPFPYSRCMLHHYLKGERGAKELSFIREDLLARMGIGFLGGQTVCSVDTEKKQIQTKEELLPYDKPGPKRRKGDQGGLRHSEKSGGDRIGAGGDGRGLRAAAPRRFDHSGGAGIPHHAPADRSGERGALSGAV